MRCGLPLESSASTLANIGFFSGLGTPRRDCRQVSGSGWQLGSAGTVEVGSLGFYEMGVPVFIRKVASCDSAIFLCPAGVAAWQCYKVPELWPSHLPGETPDPKRLGAASRPLRRKQEGKWILEKFSHRSLIYLCDIFFLSDKNGHTQIHHSSRRYIPKGTGDDKTGGLGVQRGNGHFKTRRYRTEKCTAAAFKALSVVIRQDHWKMLPLSAMRRVCVMAKKSDLTNSLPGEIRGGQCQQFHIGRQPYPLESGR